MPYLEDVQDVQVKSINNNININNEDTIAAMNEYYEMKLYPDRYKRYSSFRDALNDV
ncbi:MAG: hypothetical protein IJ576_10710 [Synergistaceae bacterium]|nr:hypothetical protein [Synergistaceae bacterium]